MREIDIDIPLGRIAALRTDGEGPRVLALHGWLAISASFIPLTAHLRDIELSCLYRTDDASPMLAAFLDVVRAFAAEQKTQPNVNGPG